MNSNVWLLTFADAISIATVLILASLGALLNERAGVLNLGVEGVLLTSAISALIAADAFGNVWLGLLVGMIAGGLLGAIHGFLCVMLRANQIVTGLALVIFGTGLANFLGKPKEGKTIAHRVVDVDFGSLSDIPVIGPVVFGHDPITYLAIALTIGTSWFIFRSRPGLTLRAVGDDPATVDAQGLSVSRIRLGYSTAGAAVMGLGGGWLMLGPSAAWYQAATVGGKGWIALALVVFAGWRPLRVIFGAILFGFTLQVPYTLQAKQIDILPSAFLEMLPYVATLIALILLSTPKARRALGAPRALGLPFVRDER